MPKTPLHLKKRKARCVVGPSAPLCSFGCPDERNVSPPPEFTFRLGMTLLDEKLFGLFEQREELFLGPVRISLNAIC